MLAYDCRYQVDVDGGRAREEKFPVALVVRSQPM